MYRELAQNNLRWDLYSKFVIVVYGVLQLIHLALLPQFMDIHYHLLTAQMFLRAGGWVSWDFLQYAPAGREHIYPPLLHFLLAFLLKCGLTPVVVAKICEVVFPVAFFAAAWSFSRRHYGESFAFFILLGISASFPFFQSLVNHLPATLAAIWGLCSLDQVLCKKAYRAGFFLTLAFYTHIGVSWLFGLGILILGILQVDLRKLCFKAFLLGLAFALPMLFKQLLSLQAISSFDFNLKEKYLSQVNIVAYLLAGWGLLLVLKNRAKFAVFLSLFLSSFIFLLYPYRYFCAEGYIPVIFLSAVTLSRIQESQKILRFLLIPIILFMLFVSPSLSLRRSGQWKTDGLKVIGIDSALMGLLYAKGSNIWLPNSYIPAAELIKRNTAEDDIIYSPLYITGVILADLAGRPTANALFPEIKASSNLNPYLSSKIIVFTKEDDSQLIDALVAQYGLIKIGENKLFLLYKNPTCQEKARNHKATLSFALIIVLIAGLAALFWKADTGKKESKNC